MRETKGTIIYYQVHFISGVDSWAWHHLQHIIYKTLRKYVYTAIVLLNSSISLNDCPHFNIHSAKSLLCDTVYYNVYSNISSNISCLRIEHYKQMRILKYCQSRAVSGILANL